MDTTTEPSAPAPIEPETDEAAELLAIYRELDDAGRAWLQWAALALLSRQPSPEP